MIKAWHNSFFIFVCIEVCLTETFNLFCSRLINQGVLLVPANFGAYPTRVQRAYSRMVLITTLHHSQTALSISLANMTFFGSCYQTESLMYSHTWNGQNTRRRRVLYGF